MNLRQGRIGDREGISLAVLIGVSNSAFLIGGRSFYRLGNQAWLAVLAGAALSLCVFLLVGRAMLRRGCGNLSELYADACGAVPALVFGAVTTLLLLVAASLPLVRMLFTLHRFIFVDAGVDLLTVYVLFALVPLVLFGLESLARTAKLLCLPVFLSYLLMVVLGIPDYEVYRLYPLLGGGPQSFLLLTGISVLCFLPPLMLLLVCGRSVHGVRNAMRLGSIAASFSGIFSALLQLAVGMAFSYRQLREIDVPVYRLILSVRGGMQMRLDKILLSVWMVGMLLGAAALLYGASLQLCHSFRFRDVRPVGAVFCVLCTTLVLLGHSTDAVFETGVSLLLRGCGAVLIVLLLLPSFISFFKKERLLCDSAA